MQEAGEEIDGLITTQSKLRQTILDATKVQSNGYKGFDILNDDGTYKTTYERMLGIAEVFKEIGEEDKKLGTNRQSLLLETVAGKTRAAAASSLLSNPQLLKSVYQDSLMNSQGSAQNELNTYLDSVEGKMAQLQNSLQQLATVTIDSEWLKDIIELGTSAVEVVTQLVDAFGGLSGILGAGIGGFLQFTGNGLFRKNGMGDWELGRVLKGMKTRFDSTNGGFFKSLENALFNTKAGDEAIKWLEQRVGNNRNATIGSAAGWNGIRNIRETGLSSLNNEDAQELIARIAENNGKDMLVDDLKKALKGRTTFKGVATSFIKDVGLTAISGLATGAVSMLVTTIATKAFEGINNYIHRDDLKIEAGKAAQESARTSRENIKNATTTFESTKDRYNELRSGVEMDRNVIKNISLTTDEYAEFLSINQQLADTFPSAITGFTESGQALVDLGTNAEEAKEKLQNLFDLTKAQNAADIKEELPSIASGISEENERLDDEILALEEGMKSYQAYSKYLDEAEKISKHKGQRTARLGSVLDEAGQDTNAGMMLVDALQKAGIDDYEWLEENGERVVKYNVDTYEQLDALNVSLNRSRESVNRELFSKQSLIDSKKAQKQSNWVQNFVPNLLEVFKNDYAYNSMADTLEETIGDSFVNILSNLDYEQMYQPFKDGIAGGTAGDFTDYIFQDILDPIYTAAKTDKELSVDIGKMFNFEWGDSTNEEMIGTLESTLEQIFPDDLELQRTVLVGLNYAYYDDEGNFHYRATDQRDRLHELFAGQGTAYWENGEKYHIDKGISDWELEKKLDQDQIGSILNAYDRELLTQNASGSWLFDGNVIKNFAQLVGLIPQFNKATEEVKTGTLKELFNNEQFQTETSGFETNISTLSSALDTFRESGELTAEQLTDLYKDIPKLAEFGNTLTMEDVGDELWKNVSGYVDKFREFMDELSPEQAKLAENFLKSYTDQFADIPVSVEGAKNALRDFFVTTEAIDSESASRRGSEEARYRDIVSSLEGKYDNDVMWSAVLSVAADINPAETTTEAFIAMVESQIAEMKIDADTSLAEAKIEKLKAGQSLAEQRIENKRNRGETITDEDYAPIYESIDGQREQIKSQQTEALRKRSKNLLDARNSVKGSATEKAYLKNAEDAVTEYLNLQADFEELDSTYMQTKQQQYQEPLNQLKTNLSTLEAVGQNLDQQRQDIEINGEAISRDLAKQIAINNTKQQNIQTAIAEEAGKLSLMDTIFNPDQIAGFLSDVVSANEAVSNLQGKTTTRGVQSESRLSSLQKEMQNIQDQASETNDLITVQQSKGLKANEQQYRKLARLSREQAKNLSDQNAELRKGLSTARNRAEVEDQIRQNESSMAQALADAYGYDDQAHNLLLTQAQDLSSAIQSAFSEMATPTGITPDTIKAISTAFSDLGSSADLSSVFYNTTDGVKANVVELQRLAQQEYELSNNDLTTKINQTTEALNRMENASGDINTAGISKLKQELADLQQQQSQVFAAYQQLMEQFSQHGQIALADQTVNQGANYDKAMNYLKEAKEMWDKGLIGTDDYKTRAAYFDEWGLSDPTRFKQNYDKFSKYMTDDIQGVHKFMMDLQSAGMATLETYEDGTQGLVMNFTDLAKAAHQFGAGEEWFRDMFGKAEEYGGMGAFVSSMEDAQLQTQKWTNELTNAQLKYAEMKREGASADDLALQQDVIDQYQGQLNAVQTATKNFQRGQAQEYVSNLKNLKSNIADLKSYYDDAMERGDEASANRFLREAQDLADDYGIKVNADFEVDEASYNAAMKDLEGKIGSWESPLGAETFGIDPHTAEFSAFEAGKTKIQNAKDAVMEYADALKGVSYDELKQIKLGNDQYDVDGLHEAEDALEGIAKAASLSSAQAEQLVPILAALGVIDFAGAINSMNQFSDSTAVATDKVEALFKGTKYEGATQFDAATMSVDELQNKLAEISEMKAQINVEEEGGQEAMDQLNELEAKTQQEYQIKLSVQQMSDKDINDFLNADYETQIDIMANMGYAESDYESFVAMVEAQQVEAPIKVKLDGSSLEGINEAVRAAIEGKDYKATVHVEADPKELEIPVKQQLEGSTYGGLTDTIIGGQSPATNLLQNAQQTYSVDVQGNVGPLASNIESVTTETEYSVPIKTDPEPLSSSIDAAVEGKERVVYAREQIIEPKGNKNSAPKNRKVTETVETKQSGGGIEAMTKSLGTLRSQMSNLPALNIDTGAAQSSLLQIYASYLRLKQAATQPITLSVSGQSVLTAFLQITSGLQAIRDNAAEAIVLSADSGQAIEQVNSLQASIDQARASGATPIAVVADVTGKEDVDALRQAIESLHGKTVPVGVSGAGNAMLEVRKLQSVINSLQGKTVSVQVSGLGNSLLGISQLKSQIASLSSKTITVTTNYVTKGARPTTKATATGTLNNISKTFAKGTITDKGILKDKEYDSHAKGDVALKEDQIALVGEVGPEGLVRDGKFSIIPGGAHFMNLKQGDIIFNNSQLKAILKGMNGGIGKVIGSARGYAQGTIGKLFGLSSAYPGGTFTWTGGQGGASNVTVSGNNNNVNVGGGTQTASTGSGNAGTGGDETPQEEDKPQFSQEIFDYVEIRLQYFADKTKYFADKITDYVNKVTKGKLLRKEITAIQDEIKANSHAATTYANFAEQLATNYSYADKDGNKKTANIWTKFNREKLLAGEYNLDIIDTTNPDDAALVEGARAYLDYINKAREANTAIQELANTMRELQDQIIQLPTEKLEQALEKVENRINTITGITSAISSGRSGIASAQRMIDFATGVAEKKKVENKSATARSTKWNTYETKKSNYEKRQSMTKTSINNIKQFMNQNNVKAKDKNWVLKLISQGKRIEHQSWMGNHFKELVNDYNNKIAKEAAAKAAQNNARSNWQKAKTKNEADKKAVATEQQRISDQAKVLMGADASADSKVPTFRTQNKYLEEELKQMKKELQERLKALREQESVTDEFEAQRARLQKAQTDRAKSIKGDKAYQAATKAEKAIIDEAMKKGQKIDPTKVSNALAHVAALWNNSVVSLENVTTALSQAKDQESKMKEELNQAALETAEREQKIAQERFENIKNWYEATVDYLDGLRSITTQTRKLWQERGHAGNTVNREKGMLRGITFNTSTKNKPVMKINKGSDAQRVVDSYGEEIQQIKDMRSALYNQRRALTDELANAISSGRIIEGSEEWKKMQTEINNTSKEIVDLEIDIGEVQDALREDVYFKAIDNVIDQFAALHKATEQFKGLISPDMMYTTDGVFTQLGIDKYAMDLRAYKEAQDEYTYIAAAIRQNNDLFGSDESYSLEEYTKRKNELEAQGRDVLATLASQRQTIIKNITDRYQTEITYINKLIDARKNELNKRKELYDYDKKLRKQNKDVQLIEQQIRALNGLIILGILFNCWKSLRDLSLQ